MVRIVVKNLQHETTDAIRQVLTEAANAPHFFDLSDAERLNWMIARGFELGHAGTDPAKRRDATAERGRVREKGS
jgi:hypothetical protein